MPQDDDDETMSEEEEDEDDEESSEEYEDGSISAGPTSGTMKSRLLACMSIELVCHSHTFVEHH